MIQWLLSLFAPRTHCTCGEPAMPNHVQCYDCWSNHQVW
jgi:hypothetical protein